MEKEHQNKSSPSSLTNPNSSSTNQQQQQQQGEAGRRICEECRSKASKYRCPGCSVRSCSLPCVKSHKLRTGCCGSRNRTHFVPLSLFDDNLLFSDFNFLEETKRAADSAQRLRMKLRAYSQLKLPFHLRNLRNAASSRRTKLLLLPSGMSKRETNRTRYDQRKKFISWTIEWRFHSTDVVLLDHGVHEDTNLSSVIEKHLKSGPWNHRLRQFCEEGVETLKFFIRKYAKGPKSPFCELDIKAPLKQQLANVVILEYPVIHVFRPSHNFDFEVIKDLHGVNHRLELRNSKPMNSISHGSTSPKGVAFKEEEIEEDNGSSDPQVFDIMKNTVTSPPSQIHRHAEEKALHDPLSDPLSAEAAGSILHTSPKSMQGGIFEDSEFDFDQGLIDAYSDLLSHLNPDDFLDLEGEFGEEVGGEQKDFQDYSGIISVENELEEGEIKE